MASSAYRVKIYIENVRRHSSIYHINQTAVVAAFAEAKLTLADFDISIAFDDEPNHAALAEANVLLTGYIDKGKLMEKVPALKWLHSGSAGMERLLPFDWLPDHIIFTNSSGAYGVKGGEFAQMALMMLNEQVPLHLENQRQHRWNQIYSTTIRGKIAVIYGFGDLGKSAAKRAKDLGMYVIGVNRSGKMYPPADEMVSHSELGRVTPRADFLLICSPDTMETRGAISREIISTLKKDVGIVNIGRAAVMDHTALAEGLINGDIGGAVLDVFPDYELSPDSPLWDVPRLIVIPHVGVDDPVQLVSQVLGVFARNLRRLMDGEPLHHQVDRILGY